MKAGARAALLLAAVFLAGLLAGVALGRTVLARPPRAVLMQRPQPPDVDRMVDRMDRFLDLTPPQADSVRRILERRQPRIVAAWTDARVALLAQVDTALAELGTVLTPAQQERLTRLLAARGVRAAADR